MAAHQGRGPGSLLEDGLPFAHIYLQCRPAGGGVVPSVLGLMGRFVHIGTCQARETEDETLFPLISGLCDVHHSREQIHRVITPTRTGVQPIPSGES